MKENEIKLIKEKLEEDNWGYFVIYYPEYKDFIGYKNVKRFWIFETKIIDFIIPKEEINWIKWKVTWEYYFFGKMYEYEGEFNYYRNDAYRIILFR